MAVIKCKMCGGDLIIEEGSSVAECEYCGSRQTIPNQDDDKKLTLFARANRLRMNSEFDKAFSIYESIVAEFPEEAEAYWGLVLCKYGIEYVDDPASGKKIPTCHRSSFDSVMDDKDFEQALENADGVARRVYRDEAKAIEEIRKGIIEVSGKEEPYDIFICYKETAENGDRTIDSVIAQDVYDALTEKGYRVFFSRITLEDKLGQEYEPYIFAALNSAKIMLAFGTDYEYYNAVWVKNEWSRYLKLMAQDKSKHLIPCYKGIDAYDMPKEFAKLQAQDMGKVGVIQDLLRGIEKILGNPKGKAASATVPVQQIVHQIVGGPNVNSLLDRGFMSLEDEDYEEAEELFNKALNSNSKCAEAYLGLLMAEMGARDKAEAEQIFVADNYVQNRYYQRAKKFSQGSLKKELVDWEKKCNDRLAKEAEEARAAKDAAEIKENKRRQEIALIRTQLEKGNYDLTEEQKQELDRLNAEADRLEAIAKKAAADYETMPEQSEKIRLEKELTERRAYHSTLGIFKGKEKKLVQEQIASMETELSTIIGRLKVAKKTVDDSQAAAKDMSGTAIGYRTRADQEARKVLQRRLMELYGVKQLENGNVTFGHYPQTKSRNDDTPIEWQILAKENGQTLVISQYVLDGEEYNSIREDITWEKCSLRTWLNETFLNNAFSAEEQAIIAMTNVSADKNMWHDTNPGNSTQDKVFLLSMAEAEKYFKSSDIFAANKLRKCDATAYAFYTSWWLRSPGSNQDDAAYVFETGSIQDSGGRVDHYKGVRPALWINLDI